MSMKKLIKTLWVFLTFFIATQCFATPVSSPWETATLGVNPALVKVDLFGFNGGITSTFEAAWPESATYAPLSTAMSTPYCASSDNTADVSPSGTGARTITVTGIDTSFAAFSEVITMNGQTSVNMVTPNVLLINTMEVTTAGSGGGNAGIIRCGTGTNTAGVPAVVHSHLPANSATGVATYGNKTASFIYGIPAGKTLLCRNLAVGSVFSVAAASVQVAIDTYTNLGLMKRMFMQDINNAGSNPSLYPGLFKCPEKTIIVGKLAGPTGSNVGPADLRAECILVDNNYLLQAGNVF